MKARYEFELKNNSCAGCAFLYGGCEPTPYTCYLTERQFGRHIDTIFNNSRPNDCPLQIVEDYLEK